VANKKISELTQATVLSQDTFIPVVSGSVTYKSNLEDINVIEKTKSQIDSLASGSSLIPGQLYKITGVDVNLYGGTDILIKAATTSTLELAGHGIFYNPKYLISQYTPGNGYGIWDISESYAIGQDAIWGGKHWTNTSGNTGTSTDKYTLSSADWDVVPFNSNDYNVETDVIHYDFLHDMIIRRKDRWDNDVDGNFQVFDEFTSPDGYGYGNPIKDFQWGNGCDDWNTTEYWYLGTQSNLVKDSYFDCLNFRGGYLWYNILTEFSSINNIIADKSYNCGIGYNHIFCSRMNDNTISGSQIYSNMMFLSDINQNTLLDGSRINGNAIEISSISNNSLSGGSSVLHYNKLHQSQVTNNGIYNSNIRYNEFTQFDASYFNLTGSRIEYNIGKIEGYINRGNLLNSQITYNSFENCVIDLQTSGVLNSRTITKISAANISISSSLSSSTAIYTNYAKQLFNNSNGVPRLGYYNGSDVFTIVNIDA
jgi:hypothetical protein